ncbi:MAG: carboxypeptidase regulatory-like domain-containing protein, partial [Bryobacteraceae bacterium]
SQILSDQFDVKTDAKLTDKDDFSVRYSWGRQELPTSNSFPLTFDSYTHNPFQNGVVNWTRTISPSMVNEARVGVNRITLWAGSTDKGLGNVAEQLGITNGNERGPGLMMLQISGGYASSIGSGQIGTQQKSVNNIFHYADNLTIIRGRHMIKTGGQLLRMQLNSFYAGGNGRMGIIKFDGHFTSNTTPYSKGFAEADFYLGYPASVARGVDSGSWGHRKTIAGLYAQDDWRVNDSLTLNLGLRWEFHSPIIEVGDRQANFEPFSGKLLLAGQNGASRALYEPFYKDFQPRVGFAWTPEFLGKKTVFRGAYTISSFMEGTGTNLRLTFNPPFSTTYESLYNTNTPGQTTDQGFTNISVKDPYKGATIMLWDPRVRPANVQQWSFTIENQLPGGNVLTAAYVGQHGTHLIVPMPYLQKRLSADGSVTKSLYLSGNSALANISQISGTEACGNQRYDSLQVQARKRLSFGFEYQASYTFSKGMTDSIGYYGDGGQAASASAYWQNLYNRGAEWGPTYFDAKNILSLSYTYEMPFGKGRKWGSSSHPLLNGMFGGWNMGGVFTSRSGFPITVTATDRSMTNSRGPRANRIGDGEGAKEVGPGHAWLDKSAFTSMTAKTFGTSGVGVVRGPGLIQFDLSLQKQFPIKEKYDIEFRSEFFNLTNTPHFGAPTQSVDSTTFGEITSAQGERSIQFALKFRF